MLNNFSYYERSKTMEVKNLQEFKTSLNAESPDPGISIQLQSLWHDGKGNWEMAHQQVDQLNDQASARIHAYLHRKEGDLWNADYWYRRAGESRPDYSLDEEWEVLVMRYLND
jgi:hypothetical protein